MRGKEPRPPSRSLFATGLRRRCRLHVGRVVYRYHCSQTRHSLFSSHPWLAEGARAGGHALQQRNWWCHPILFFRDFTGAEVGFSPGLPAVFLLLLSPLLAVRG